MLRMLLIIILASWSLRETEQSLSIHVNKINFINYSDSGKNYEFSGSSLQHNPITNPVNSYNFEFNRFRQGNSYSTNAANALNSINLPEVAIGRSGKR